MPAADGDPELGLDGLCNIPVGAALAEADGGDPVAGDLEFEVGVGATVGRTGWDRWNVEHTFTGLDNFRRLVVRYGRQHMPASSLP